MTLWLCLSKDTQVTAVTQLVLSRKSKIKLNVNTAVFCSSNRDCNAESDHCEWIEHPEAGRREKQREFQSVCTRGCSRRSVGKL